MKRGDGLLKTPLPWEGLRVDIPTPTVDGPIKRSKSTLSLSDCFDEHGHQVDTCGHRYGGTYCPSSMVSFPRHSPKKDAEKKKSRMADCIDAPSPTSTVGSCSGSEAEGDEACPDARRDCDGAPRRRSRVPAYPGARTGALMKDREVPPLQPHTPTGSHMPASCMLSDGSNAMFTDGDQLHVGLSHVFSTPSTDNDAHGAKRPAADMHIESPVGLPFDADNPFGTVDMGVDKPQEERL
jgi:hypothetical protein